MKFYPKGMLLFAAFAAVVILAANARAGHIDPSFAVVGIVAIVAIEAALFFGLFSGRKQMR
jgi:glucan phosphoethanolaminetransferase (alkaline phosphatase superfamily)